MKKKLSISFFLMIGFVFAFVGSLHAQDDGVDFNVQNQADDSQVQGNGTQPGQNQTGVHVNTFTGDAEATVTDFNYRRIGFPMKFERYFHNGITSPEGELGSGWMTNYDICLFIPAQNSNGNSAVLVLPHKSWSFSTSDGVSFTAPPGCFYSLQNVNGIYNLKDSKGIVYKFQVQANGETNIAHLIEIDDLNGNKVNLSYQTFSYYQETPELFFAPSCNNGCTGTTTGDSGCRLQSVSGNNWNINFNYYDNVSAPVTELVINLYPAFLLFKIVQQNQFGFRLKSVTNSAEDTISFDSSAQYGPVSQVLRSPNSLNASYQYYSYTATTPMGSPTTITTLRKVVDPLAPAGYRDIMYVSENAQNGINNPVRQIVNNMNQVIFNYDYSTDGSGNRLTSTSGPNGLIETDVYDSTKRIIQKRFQVDGHPFNEFYTWNLNDLMTNKIDGNGNAVTMNYDSLGNMIFRQDAEGYQEYYTYNNIGRLTNSTDKNQVSRSYNYDGSGNLISENEPGRTLTYSYYSNGLLNTAIDANQHITTYSYDVNGNLSTIQKPSGSGNYSTTTYVFDNFITSNGQGRGLLTSKNDPLQQTTIYNYNSNNFLWNIQYADSTSVTYNYNGDGAITQVIDQNGNVTATFYDSEDRPVSIVKAEGTTVASTTIYQLDSLGNQLSITDNKSQVTNFTYNEQSLVRASSDSSGVGVINSYDGALNLLSTKSTRGITRAMNYYKNNRLKSILFSDGTPGISYTYDGNGNRKSMIDGVGLKTYNYDPLNKLQTFCDSTRNFTLSYTYDAVGNRKTVQSNKFNGTMYYGYYDNNLTKAVTDVDGMTTSYIYDAMKKPTNIYYPNGASVTCTYIGTNHRLTELQNLNSKQELISNFYYSYDNLGNITGMGDFAGPWAYSYDNLNELTTVARNGTPGVEIYQYDKSGNRASFSPYVSQYNYISGNELISDSNENFVYDGDGNLSQRTSSAGTTTYSWNALNELIRTVTASGSVTFLYDGDGHRLQKSSSKGTINYFYDGNSVIAETDASGILKTYNPGISVKDQKGNKLFFVQNGHKDVVGLIDTNQNLVQSYEYDPFGAVLGDQKDPNNYRYVGLSDVYSDDDIGLQYMWHRWYDPKLGRFINRDPIGFKGGDNFYEYSQNNPINLSDPSGNDPLPPDGSFWEFELFDGLSGENTDSANKAFQVVETSPWELTLFFGAGADVSADGYGASAHSGAFASFGNDPGFEAGVYSTTGLGSGFDGLYAGAGLEGGLIDGGPNVFSGNFVNTNIAQPGFVPSSLSLLGFSAYSSNGTNVGYGFSFGPSFGFGTTTTNTVVIPLIGSDWHYYGF